MPDAGDLAVVPGNEKGAVQLEGYISVEGNKEKGRRSGGSRGHDVRGDMQDTARSAPPARKEGSRAPPSAALRDEES
jgi:hypothetical protein